MNSLAEFPALHAYIESLRSIPGGNFQMGGHEYFEEQPIHGVTLSPFRIGATPVTVAVWKEYCVATDIAMPDEPRWGWNDEHPVVNLGFFDEVEAFCAWASHIAGFRLTVPTEAQFEFAARGGQDGLDYPWGNIFDDSMVWSSVSYKRSGTAPVNRSSNIFENAYGLTDMCGNVFQWCSDFYGPFSSVTQTDPIGPVSEYDAPRCLRGGSWETDEPFYFRCAFRENNLDRYFDNIGFRLSAGPAIADEETVFELKDVGEKSSNLLFTAAAREDTSTAPRLDTGKRFSVSLNNYPALRDYINSLRVIPGGAFQMGSSNGNEDETPVHSVTLSMFRMGATPVTVAVWKEYSAATKIPMPEDPTIFGWWDDHPVVNVSWNDIMGDDGMGGFCAWASDIAGFRLTLPTEAQFEYAARGGFNGLEYPWGNVFDETRLWLSGFLMGEANMTAPVNRTSSIFQNAYGLTDMSGNLWQWCSDLYGPYSNCTQNDPIGPSSTSDYGRCMRGGSWKSDMVEYFRCASRLWADPDSLDDDIGFRLSAGPD